MRVLRTIGWVGLGLVVLVAVVVGSAFAVGRQRLANAPAVPVRVVAVASDAAALERGRHLVHHVAGCAGCHGADLAGTAFFQDRALGTVPAPNLTAGVGGFGRDAAAEDWVRAVRHGIGRDGRVLGAMPSDLYAHLSDDDFGAVLAYVQSVPPVDREWPARGLTPVGTLVFGVVGFSTLPYAKIDHAGAHGPVPHPVEEVSAAYGRYVTTIATCSDCHGPDLRGYQGPPGPPPGPDITSTGALGYLTSDEFVHLLRTGLRPDGRPLGLEMPWAGYAGMTDDELGAMYLYLRSLPDGG
jgi:mono/diheme cytochrome c family protein